MNNWYGKIFLLIGLILTMLIRIPHDKKSSHTKIVLDRKGKLEKLMLGAVGVGFLLLPLVFMATPVLSFANYELTPLAFALGILCLAGNIWLFYRSHADLGANWSASLQIREQHQLVESGVYKKIRHPMYSAIFLYAIAQSLLLANWIAGPACLITFSLLYVFRVKHEERMMLERFGDKYSRYMERTKLLIPGVY